MFSLLLDRDNPNLSCMKTLLSLSSTGFLICIFFFSSTLHSQLIKGTVTDENNIPMPGASVVIQGTQQGVSTDFDGNYSIEVTSGQSLIISFVGYSSQTILVGNTSRLDVQMIPDNSLEEVVVSALAIKRNTKAVGYSVSQVAGEAINTNKTTNAINALQGKIAGVQITGDAANIGTGGWGQQLSGINYHIMRYADVLLMAADAAVESGDLEKGRTYVNTVRERAKNMTYIKDSSGADAANYSIELYNTAWTDQIVARKAVRMERRLDLGMEGHRTFDLRRWGISKDVINTYIAKESEVITTFNKGWNYYS